VIFDEAPSPSLPVLKTGANLGARVDDIDVEHAIYDDLILDVLGDILSGVVGVDLYGVARRSGVDGMSVGKWRYNKTEKSQTNVPQTHAQGRGQGGRGWYSRW